MVLLGEDGDLDRIREIVRGEPRKKNVLPR
jgi:hypothetical protein